MRKQFVIISTLVLLIVVFGAFNWSPIGWLLIIISPIIILGYYDMFQKKHVLLRNFPLVGRGRYMMEWLRPKIYQYFVESDVDGRPISRIYRSVVYQRAKGQVDTTPFGTQLDVYRVGYEWMSHSIAALKSNDCNYALKAEVGGRDCQQPYNASILNISAMSFGALSRNAVLALNAGAKFGGFAHNTGEGGISPYHLEPGGDLIWQIGTGYFGCRDKDGNFSEELFKETVSHKAVKMIEIKISQGAKPGHGGILPAAKNTPEIARIRGVKANTDVISPPGHSEFSTPLELMAFIQKLRILSNGKPIGFKLCVGVKSEFIAVCKAMIRTGITPDFITVDGSEGGTGAAPLEYSNSVGMPLREGLAFVVDSLIGFNLKQDIKVIAGGKILTGFHVIKHLALGADMVNSARAMMLALGCIQALECNRNTCPTGITTQNLQLIVGLDVKDKARRVARFHEETIKSVVELLAAGGRDGISDLNRSHIYRRTSATEIKRYDEIYPALEKGCLLSNDIPGFIKRDFDRASALSFEPIVQ